MTIFALLMAGPAFGQGAHGRWSPREYEARAKDPIVWASEAKASNVYDNFRYGAAFATGAPNVFPRYGLIEQQWLPANKRGEATLELTFPPTDARQVRIFETNAAGTVRKVIDASSGEQVLFETTAAPGKYTEGQVLWVDLPAPRRVTRLKVVVDATPALDWPGIDAVGLVGQAVAAPRGATHAGRWSASQFKPDPATVWAKDAKASSTYDNFRYGTEAALGAPTVFPKLGRHDGAWAPGNRRSTDDWLEVRFPPVMARQVRIFETMHPGTITKVVNLTGGERVLYASSEKPPVFSEAQVLWIDLPTPERVEVLRIHVNASLSPDWPHLDAVGLIGAKLADPGAGASGRWSPSEVAAQPGGDQVVWATGAKASGEYDKARYAMTFATGKPDVFPHYGDQPKAWKTGNRSDGQWIELSFPKTRARQVRIYETQAAGSIKKVIDTTAGEHVLYDFTERKSPAFTEAQVLYLNLPEPRAIEKVKILVHPSLSGGWPQIDAVGLVPAAP